MQLMKLIDEAKLNKEQDEQQQQNYDYERKKIQKLKKGGVRESNPRGRFIHAFIAHRSTHCATRRDAKYREDSAFIV